MYNKYRNAEINLNIKKTGKIKAKKIPNYEKNYFLFSVGHHELCVI